MSDSATMGRAGSAAAATSALHALEGAGIIVDSDIAGLAEETSAADARRSGWKRRTSGLIPKRAARSAMHRLAAGRFGRRLLLSVLDDPRMVSWILHRLSNRSAARASFDDEVLPGPGRVEGFEDCFWLFSSNPLNHGLARLEFDEAAYLHRLVRSLGEPATVEIGRFRGGTTFLLAAAGARVVSVDKDIVRQSRFSLELAAALSRFGLRDRVEIAVADSRTYPVELDSLDLVFVDGDHSYSGVRADFEHWWPALAPGGHLVFHDAVFPPTDSRLAVTEGVVRFVAELDSEQIAERRPAPGSLAHFVKPRGPQRL